MLRIAERKRPSRGPGRVIGTRSTDRHAAADGAVQHLRGLLDAVGGGVQRIGHRVLRRPGAIRRRQGGRRATSRVPLQGRGCAGRRRAIRRTPSAPPSRSGAHRRSRRTCRADFRSAIPGSRRVSAAAPPALLAGHPVLPAVDGDVDMAHESSPASSTERMVPIAASSRSAISRLARSSRRDFTSDPSSSSASRDRSAPSA